MVDKIGIQAAQPDLKAASSGRNDPARVRDAACQFESLLIGQLLKSARGSSSGWLSDGDEDQAGGTATDMAEEQLAKTLASQGGLGLARMVVSGLEKGTGSGVSSGH
jgi:Rod binding domain-containing protein